jgi:hypothetical protein
MEFGHEFGHTSVLCTARVQWHGREGKGRYSTVCVYFMILYGSSSLPPK